MDFSWNEQDRELRAALIAFCRTQLPLGDVARRDQDAEFSSKAWRLCGEQGLLGMHVPEQLGGLGLSALTGAYLMEAFGYGCEDRGLAFSVAAHLYACMHPIQEFGTPAQRSRFLPRLASGAAVGCHAMTEPEAGSDVFSMKTRAVLRGDVYVLDGVKCFVTNGPVGDVFLVHAVTDPRKKFFSLSTFLVDRDTPGLTVGRPHQKLGLRTSPLGDLYFDACEVPVENRLGLEGQGGVIFTSAMARERTCLIAIYVGAMQRQLEESIAYARERKQFGQHIGSFQAVSHKLVDMKVRHQAAQLLLYKSAWELTRGEEDPDAGVAKLFISEAAVQSGLDAIQLRGAFGVLSGSAERFLRDAIPSRVFSGTSEIQRNNLASALGI